MLSVSVSLFSFKNFLILFFMMIWKWNFLLMCPKWLHLLYICGWFYMHYGFRFYKTCHLSLIWALLFYCLGTTMLLNILTPPCNWHDPKTSTMVGRVLTLLKEVWFYVWYNHYIKWYLITFEAHIVTHLLMTREFHHQTFLLWHSPRLLPQKWENG